ncbi:hypothetical protein GF369_01080 [Candidatus Peregrinibacteria bacterium]|nr:hypothetical protein [Candidatus Peregrinibacteria bacterium]
MAKKTKTKGWVKGVIALAVVGVIGVLGYYGANGELFQGRSFRVAAPKMDRLKTEDVERLKDMERLKVEDAERLKDMERLKVDGVADKVARDIAIDEAEKVAFELEADTIEVDKVLQPESELTEVQPMIGFDVAQPTMADLEMGDTDIEMLSVSIDNNLTELLDIEKVAFLQDGEGLESYELFADGVKINATVDVQKVYLDKLGKTVNKVIFTFDRPLVVGPEQDVNFVLKADVNERLKQDVDMDSVSVVLDSFLTEKGLETNRDIDFDAFSRKFAL